MGKKSVISIQTAQIWANDMQKFLYEIDPDTFWLPDIPIVVVDKLDKDDFAGMNYSMVFTIAINLCGCKKGVHILFENIIFPKIIYGTPTDMMRDYIFNVVVHEMLHMHQYIPMHTSYMNKNRSEEITMGYEDDVEYMSLKFIIKNFDAIKKKYKSYLGADLHKAIVTSFYKGCDKKCTSDSLYKKIMRDNSLYPDHGFHTTYRKRSFLDVYLCFIDHFVDNSRKDIVEYFLDKEMTIIFKFQYLDDTNQFYEVTVASEGYFTHPSYLFNALKKLGYTSLAMEREYTLTDIMCLDKIEGEVILTFTFIGRNEEDLSKMYHIHEKTTVISGYKNMKGDTIL